ncbi:nitrate reductase cytochrome c-type subunit [Uliginosibacterium aquaticum]|uniref:Periplasmic nitrate reductase, electron transfer subunit n=1 Tax=Uliginosibacterium aquaticum TaxID=2731212 RepID=A0ABX2IBV5_9RHOO|nr:nitrate reductase cytochrome c-type subunit [Uliginosibacterium aquaticum]NSL53422.1 nitrate reductase cytochrome c-type subunit [Uliginosibacterium aquaticum]
MKKLILTLIACLMLAPAYAQKTEPVPDPLAGVKAFGMRGVPIDGPEAASDNFRNERDQPPLPRDFVQQPPLIPHTVKGYNITKNFNKCMDCHAWNRTKDTGATKVSVTHFKTREGTELSNISPRRYFCTQCHVPQTDAKPLVANKFQPAAGMR